MAHAARRRELSVIDDPLQSHKASEHARPRLRNDQPIVAPEAVKAVFGRVPASLARRLEGAVFELRATRPRVTQQDVLAALLWRYVDHEAPEKLDELTRLLDEYAAARGDPR